MPILIKPLLLQTCVPSPGAPLFSSQMVGGQQGVGRSTENTAGATDLVYKGHGRFFSNTNINLTATGTKPMGLFRLHTLHRR